MASLIIVGAGFFGMVAARLAQRQGWDVIVVDDGRPGSGSKPAAGLIKPSWLDGYGQAGRWGLKILDELFGFQEMEFHSGLLKFNVKFIHPPKVLNQRDISVVHARVTSWGDGFVVLQGGERLHGYVYVAAGVWTNELVAQCPPVRALRGSAFLYTGQVDKNLLVPWAPYKQIKVFNYDKNTVWTGDSTGVKPESYTDQRQHASILRCDNAVRKAGGKVERTAPDLIGPVKQLTGDRPVVDGAKTGYFAQVKDRVWVGTGGGKMGITLAAYHAQQLMTALKGRR